MKDAIDMEVNKGLLAFFGEEEGAVGGVAHEYVFGEGGCAVPGGCTVEPPPAREVLLNRGTLLNRGIFAVSWNLCRRVEHRGTVEHCRAHQGRFHSP